MNELNTDDHLLKNAVKSRFFAQYWGQNILSFIGSEVDYKLLPHSLAKNENWSNRTQTIEKQFIVLKSLSKITDEDAEHIVQLEAFIDGFLSEDFLEFLIDLKKGHCNKFQVVDYLRSKGYAIPFMEYSVDDLVSFGWVQLL